MNRRGFTLIELLAVVIILGVIMMIAIPNVLGMLDKNKKNSFVESARTMISRAEYTIRKDTSIEYPSNGKAIILTLEYLNTADISNSPYDTEYSPTRSFVAIVNHTENEVTEYKYYVHLVACSTIDCSNTNKNLNRGINLIYQDNLTGNKRYQIVKQGNDVNIDLGKTSGNTMVNESQILSITGASGIEKVFSELS